MRCGPGSSSASGPSRVSAGSGSARAGPIPPGSRGTGWWWGGAGRGGRRAAPAAGARRDWLVVGVASLWVLAPGPPVEDAHERALPPARLRSPPASPAAARPRRISLFRLGLQWLRHLLARGRPWRRLWLAPEPWPQPPPGLAITIPGTAA